MTDKDKDNKNKIKKCLIDFKNKILTLNPPEWSCTDFVITNVEMVEIDNSFVITGDKMEYEYLRFYPNNPENYLNLNVDEIKIKKYLLFGPKVFINRSIDREYYLKSKLETVKIVIPEDFIHVKYTGEYKTYKRKEPGEK
jgi:hypothetical protein